MSESDQPQVVRGGPAWIETSAHDVDPGVEVEIHDAQGNRLNALELEGPDVADLADLLSMVSDVQRSAELAELRARTEDQGLQQALWSAAVTSYGRAFQSGLSHGGPGRSRRRVPQDILDRMPAPLAAEHTALLEERNKHLAHRVSDLEQIHILAISRPDPPAFVGLHSIEIYSTGSADDAPVTLQAVATWLADELQAQADREWQALLKSVAADERWRPKPAEGRA